MVHRQGACRAAVPSNRSGSRARCERHVRAGSPLGLARPSAGSDAHRDVGSWLCAELGGPVEEIHAGDVVSCPPGEKHWHGATPDSALTHLAIQEELDGKVVSWMEKVSGEQYQQKRPITRPRLSRT